MQKIRAKNVLGAATASVAALGFVTWSADPAWARAAGLDVWNIGRCQDDLNRHETEAARLRAWQASLIQQHEMNRFLVLDVAMGRRALGDAASEMYETNRGMPGYVATLECFYPGPTLIAQSASNILGRIVHVDSLSQTEKAAALERLRAEYQATFGVAVQTAKFQ